MARDQTASAARPPALQTEPFGATPDGRTAQLYTLENDVLRVCICDFGGRMVRIEAPDRHGQRDDVLLGFDNVRTYATAGGAFGALLGRNANRIAGGRLTIDGQDFRLVKNEGDNTLHGGAIGFDKVFWTVASAEGVAAAADQASIQLYTGNKLNGAIAGHGGVIYRQSAGLALEPQGFPDAPHHANFPSTILRAGEDFRRVICYRFSST